jgi:hypothetical protein
LRAKHITGQKIISRTFKISGTLVFLCPKKRERESESKKGKGKERERTKEWAIIFLNRPGQNEKSANYTVHGRERYSM